MTELSNSTPLSPRSALRCTSKRSSWELYVLASTAGPHRACAGLPGPGAQNPDPKPYYDGRAQQGPHRAVLHGAAAAAAEEVHVRVRAQHPDP